MKKQSLPTPLSPPVLYTIYNRTTHTTSMCSKADLLEQITSGEVALDRCDVYESAPVTINISINITKAL